MDEAAPRWSQDYEAAEDMDQVGTGKEALKAAFRQCHAMGRVMEPGDVVGLDDGELWQCEVEGWTDIRTLWVARVENSRKRER